MKNTIKKILSIISIWFALLSCFSCKAKTIDTSGKIKIVCTIFPEYDWLLNIIGMENEKILPTLLIKSGVDLHNYQPSTQDMINISNADLLIYVGGESDKWINDALLNSTNKNQKVLNLMEILKDNLYEEEIVEGMQAEEDEEELSEEELKYSEVEYDEHVWLSLKNAQIIVKELNNTICELDKEHAEFYTKNAQEYILKLSQLDEKYQTAIENYNQKPLIFCDRFPFRYLTQDYNLKYYAAFLGCSTESNASFETIVFLASKLNEFDIQNVIKIDNSSDKLANTVIANAKKPSCNIITLDSMQSTTLSDSFNGKTYLSTMESNLTELQKIIN